METQSHLDNALSLQTGNIGDRPERRSSKRHLRAHKQARGTMSVTYVIQIPNFHPVKVNELLEAHHYAAERLKRQTTEMIWAYAKHIPPAETKRNVHIAIYRERGRLPDGDAFYKAVFDALVNLKLLIDDSVKWLSYQPTDILTGKKSTIITLRDL